MATTKPQVRVREPGRHALYNAEQGVHVTPGVEDYFEQDDPLVRAHRWAFATDAELAEQRSAARGRESVSLAEVEAATAAPGEKRATRRS